MKEELKHHPRGMSKWPAMLACGCFEGAEGGKDAEFGTEKHAQLAQILGHLKEHGILPSKQTDTGFFEAGVYRAAEMIRDSLIANNVDLERLHIEERVTLECGTFGTADVWFDDGHGRLFVWDFKTFRNPGRDYTAQLAGYALAICQEREERIVKRELRERPIYEAHLRTIYGDSSIIDSTMMDLFELQSFRDDAMRAFDNAANAQPTQCNWCEICSKFATCPACTAVANKVQETLADAPMKWETYTPAKKAQVMLLAEFLGKWSEDVKKAAKQTLLDGGVVADEAIGAAWTIVSKRGALEVNTAAACKALVDKGVDVNEIRKELKLSATGVKSLLKLVGIKGKAADAIVEACGTRGADSAQIKRV